MPSVAQRRQFASQQQPCPHDPGVRLVSTTSDIEPNLRLLSEVALPRSAIQAKRALWRSAMVASREVDGLSRLIGGILSPTDPTL
ncbi:hypothetical protein PG990_005634 [Apiospora arundinis]